MKEFGEKRITELYGNKSLGDEDDQDSQTSGSARYDEIVLMVF